jgi:hypothetical protein
MRGSVRDETDALVPGVTITASNAEAGIVRTVVTGSDGRFSIPALSVGTYSVRAEHSGFSVELLNDVALTVGSAADLSITIRVSPVTEQALVVAAATSLVDTQKTAIATVVGQQAIDNLPIKGRNFISFAVMAPGVNVDRSPTQGAAATSALVFVGQRPRSNNITVDGLDNNEATVGSVRATFSQEAIREFQVLTSSYSAEFGKAAGGVLNIVTRSGSNAFGGNAYLYFRDEALNAKGYFERFSPAGASIDLGKAPYDHAQFGGTLGGPLKRDRSFFFFSFERLDVDAAQLVTIDDTTLVPNPFGGPPLGTPAGILRQAGFPIETGDVPLAFKKTQFLGKFDHRLTDTQQLAVRGNVSDTLDENIEPWGGIVAKSRGAVLDANDYAVAATHTLLTSKGLVNEARGQYAVRDQTIDSLDPNCPLPCVGESQGGPTLIVGGVGLMGRQLFTPNPRTARRFQALDTLTYYTGLHQLKTGFDFSRIDTDARLPLGFGGQYVFAALPAIPGITPAPISSIQAVALGLPASYFQGYGNSEANYPYSDLSVFAQDDWTLTPKLTLKLGLRYQVQFWPEGYPRDSNDFAPRLSAAWDPTGRKKTVIRGSYGMFYDNTVTAIVPNTIALNGTTGVRSFVAAFPSPIPMMAWNAPGHRVATPPGETPSVIALVDPDLRTSYTHQASAGIDYEVNGDWLVTASFVYVRGFNFLGAVDYNPIVVELGPGRRPADINGQAGTSSGVTQYTSYAETWYRGLLLSASKRQGRYTVLASYTLSKTEDNVTDYIGSPQFNGRGRDPNNPTGLPIGFDPYADKGPSTQDQRHRVVVSAIVTLPWDVQASSIVTVGSGRPYDLGSGIDFNLDGNPSDRPRRNPAAAPLDHSTSVGRNAGLMPGEATVDLRVQKRVPLGTGIQLDALIEIFNLFNRTNFVQVNRTWGPGAYPTSPLPTFGQFTEAGAPRQVQLAAKLSF